MKTIHFTVKSRSTPTSKPVSSADDLYKTASELLRMEMQSCSPQPLRLRLMGKYCIQNNKFYETQFEKQPKCDPICKNYIFYIFVAS